MKTKEQAIELVKEGKKNYYLKCLAFAQKYLQKQDNEFTSEDLRQAYESENKEIPKEPRVWGAVILYLKKNNQIELIRYEKYKSIVGHGKPCAVWKKIKDMQNDNLKHENPIDANNMLATALTSPALKWQSNKGGRMNYPANFRGRVPLKVKVAKNVTPDLMELKNILGIKKDTICLKDNEYYVWVNSYGAVSAILPNGERLGLLPSEFDVTEWHS